MSTLAGERLEWLGDALVGLAVLDYLHKTLPHRKKQDQSFLTRHKHSAVSNFTLSRVAVSMGIHNRLVCENDKIHEVVENFVNKNVNARFWPWDEPRDDIRCLKVLANALEAEWGLKVQKTLSTPSSGGGAQESNVLGECQSSLVKILGERGWGGYQHHSDCAHSD